jgi:outer membrane usher protein
MGRHRVGITDEITLGGRFEARDETISAGPVLTAQTPIGQFEIEVGASRSTGDTEGFASSLAYSFASHRFGAGLLGRYVTDHYATVGTSVDDDRSTMEAGIFASVPIGNAFSISGQATSSNSRDHGVAHRLSGQIGTRIAGFLNASVGAGLNIIPPGTTLWTVFLSLSAMLPEHQMASIRGSVEEKGTEAQFMVTRSPQASTDYGYRAIANLGNVDSADLSAQYQVPFGRYGAWYLRDANGDHFSLDAAGALVVVPGVGLFATRPVQDGFGVIRLEGVSGVRGYVNNQDAGKTNYEGNLVVPNLLSYYGNRLSIETEDIPMRYSLGQTEMLLAPPHRGAAIANFPVVIPHYCRGTVVVDHHGTRIVPKYGEFHIQRTNDEYVSPIGELGEFELEGIASGSHKIVIDYAEGTCEGVLNVVSSRETIVELGEIVCTER